MADPVLLCAHWGGVSGAKRYLGAGTDQSCFQAVPGPGVDSQQHQDKMMSAPPSSRDINQPNTALLQLLDVTWLYALHTCRLQISQDLLL